MCKKELSAKSDMENVTSTLLKMLGKGMVQKDRLHLEQLRQTWSELIGKVMYRHSWPQEISRRHLTVLVDNPVWSGELLIHQEMLLEKFNKALGGNYLKEITFKVSRFSRKNLVTKEEVKVVLPELTESEKKEALKDCPVLKNKELQKKAENFYQKQLQLQKYFQARGQKQCPVCGAFIESDSELCPFCSWKAQKEQRQKIAELLKQEPWLTYTELKKKCDCEQIIYNSVRDSLRAFYDQKVKLQQADENEERLAVLLQSGKHPQALSATDYANIIEFIRGKKHHVHSSRK
jgi:hypothetical protein